MKKALLALLVAGTALLVTTPAQAGPTAEYCVRLSNIYVLDRRVGDWIEVCLPVP